MNIAIESVCFDFSIVFSLDILSNDNNDSDFNDDAFLIYICENYDLGKKVSCQQCDV